MPNVTFIVLLPANSDTHRERSENRKEGRNDHSDSERGNSDDGSPSGRKETIIQIAREEIQMMGAPMEGRK